MEKEKYYKAMFLVAGIYNIVASFGSWLGYVIRPEVSFGLIGMSIPPTLFQTHMMYMLLVMFGVGYLIVSRDISKNHGIVLIAAIGKVFFFTICLLTFLLKEANIILLFVGIGAIIFSALFTEFLLRVRRTSS